MAGDTFRVAVREGGQEMVCPEDQYNGVVERGVKGNVAGEGERAANKVKIAGIES
jgi:hypothetical protein